MDKIDELNGSELGTIQYWEKNYEMEIKNYVSFKDPGEVWFSEESQDRVIQFLEKYESVTKDDSIIDIGSGNGLMLIELLSVGYKNLTGIDYSPKAIELAKKIAADKGLQINYIQCDMICDKDVSLLGKFKVCHDKGTYDAISLMLDNPTEKRNKYLKNVSKILEDDGIFVITSCNWSENELVVSFSEYFDFLNVIQTPKFKFGGKVGSVVSSVVFTKKK